MAKLLIEKNYSVHGICRKKNHKNLKALNLLTKVNLYILPRLNELKIYQLLKKNFNEIYFLGGQSSVNDSFLKRVETYESQISPLKLILDYIVQQKVVKSKFLYAGSSEIYGNANYNKKLTEDDKKKPVSPYGLSKLIGYEIIKSYRTMFNIPVCTAILFNHESPLRPEKFVFKKIINSVEKVRKNNKVRLRMGNIEVKRDWGWGPEYMMGCHKILNSKKIDDYIIATGKTIALKKIIEECFKKYDLNWKKYTIIEKQKYRKFEIKENYSSINKLKKNINWSPKNDYMSVIKKLSKP
jgi:GDPmannose 4,6-dehydratase